MLCSIPISSNYGNVFIQLTQKKSKNSFKPIFKCLNVIVGFCTDKQSTWGIVSSLFQWFSINVMGNLIHRKIRNTHVIKYLCFTICQKKHFGEGSTLKYQNVSYF